MSPMSRRAAAGDAGDAGAARLSIRVPFRPSAVSRARSALSELSPHVDSDTLDSLRLLVSELVTNSLLHSGAAAGEPVSVDVSVTAATVRMEVIDRGRGFDLDATRARPPERSGWGLVLVERLADRWGVHRRHGTCVWVEIDRRAAPRVHARAS